MGNAHASAAPPVPVPAFASPIDSSAGKSDSTPGNESTATNSRNPGTLEDLHKRCKDVFPSPIEGVRLSMNKGLSNHFQVSHTLTMSNVMPSGYKFGATYVGTNIVGPGEAYPVMLGEIDPSGNLSANIMHQFHPRVKTKLSTQVRVTTNPVRFRFLSFERTNKRTKNLIFNLINVFFSFIVI